MVPLLVPRVGEERPQLGHAARRRAGARATTPRRREQNRTLVAPASATRRRPVGDARAPHLQRQHVVRRAGGGERGGGLTDAGADLDDQRRLAAEPATPARSRVGRRPRRGSPTPSWWRLPGLGLARGEPAAAAGVGQHLAHPPAVLGQLVVAGGRGARGSGIGTVILPPVSPRTMQRGPGPGRVRGRSGGSAGRPAADHLVILVTRPAPTVRPPSRIAKRRPSSMAIGWISSTDISVLSPGMTISVPSGRVTTPVTSVVRK